MLTRRTLLATASALAAASATASDSRPALLGGSPVRTEQPASWPRIHSNDEEQWSDVLRSRKWHRRAEHYVADFERAWGERLGAEHVVATNGGTTALYAALHAADVGPKDEVIVPPYTFVATINAVLLHHALPIFVDTDPGTFQIDASKIEAALTPRTRVLLPVHMGGAAADMDAITAVAGKHGKTVIEDACQAHLAEWKGRKVGTLGDIGCFSFQASKNLTCGEGGALVTNDAELARRGSAFQNNGAALHGSTGGLRTGTGCNLRMTEFQGALLLSQMERLETQARRREQNAAYLTRLLDDIPGVTPARMYSGCTRNAYHLYMFRYDPTQFAGLTRKRFIAAMKAEGIPLSSGYTPLNLEPFVEQTLRSRAFRAIYSDKEIADWRERNRCPRNDRLCEEALWMGQPQLLGERWHLEQVVEAIEKTRKHAADLA